MPAGSPIPPIDLDAITRIVNDDKTSSADLLRIIQRLISIIRDHETRLDAGGL